MDFRILRVHRVGPQSQCSISLFVNWQLKFVFNGYEFTTFSDALSGKLEAFSEQKRRATPNVLLNILRHF